MSIGAGPQGCLGTVVSPRPWGHWKGTGRCLWEQMGTVVSSGPGAHWKGVVVMMMMPSELGTLEGDKPMPVDPDSRELGP